MPPWNLANIDIFRTTEPKDGIRDESYWTNHAGDLSVLMYDAQGFPVPWTGTTRFELVLPPNIFKENGRNYMWVPLGEKHNIKRLHALQIVFPNPGPPSDNTSSGRKLLSGNKAKRTLMRPLRNAVFLVFLLTLLNIQLLPHL